MNTPFIYQFFSCRKGLITRTKFSSARQFGTFSLSRKLRWASTPQHVRRALHSPLFHRRVRLWEIIQDLGSNSIRRFHMEKRLRSNEIGAQGCYFIRCLAMQQSWRTPTILCHQCHRQGLEVLESQTSSKTHSSSSTVAFGIQLDARSSQAPHLSCTHDQQIGRASCRERV